MKLHRWLTAALIVSLAALSGCTKKSEGPMADTTKSTPSPTGSEIISPRPTSWDERKVAPVPEPSVTPKYRVNEIAFDENTTKYGKEGEAVCREIATTLMSKHASKVFVVGMTDKYEADSRLGMKRAETVKNCLVSHGLAGGIFELSSYGSTMAVADKQQPDLMRSERRVEIWVLSE